MTTSTKAATALPLTLAKLEEMIREIEKIGRDMRRNQIRLQIELGHDGPMLRTKHPVDGTVIECSYAQALQIHAQWPFVLDTVVDRDTALFRPANIFDSFVPKILPCPPYDPPMPGPQIGGFP